MIVSEAGFWNAPLDWCADLALSNSLLAITCSGLIGQ
jgi:hypothetical protein